MTVINALVKLYLESNAMVNHVDTADWDGMGIKDDDTVDAVLNKLRVANVVSVGNGYLAGYWERRDELGFTAQHFIDAQQTINKLVDAYNGDSYPYFSIKLETGGLAGYMREHGRRGSDIFPILRVTVGTRPTRNDPVISKTWYIKPEFGVDLISPKVKRILEKSGNVLTTAQQHGRRLEEVELDIVKFIQNNTSSQSTMVCSNEVFVKAFLDAQLPEVSRLFSPAYIDVNHILRHLRQQQQEPKAYLQYMETPEAYVAALLDI